MAKKSKRKKAFAFKPLKNDLQEYINEQMEDGEFEKEFNKQRKRFEKIMAKIKKRK